MKKILLKLNILTLPLVPLALVISCNSNDKIKQIPATFEDLKQAIKNNKDLIDDLAMLTSEDLSDDSRVKLLLKKSMAKCVIKQGNKKRLNFEEIINSLSWSIFKETKHTLRLEFGMNDSLIINHVDSSTKKDGDINNFYKRLIDHKNYLKSKIEKLFIINDSNADLLKEALWIATLNKSISFDNCFEQATLDIVQPSNKMDFRHAKLKIMINVFKPIIFNKVELNTNQDSSDLKNAINEKKDLLNQYISKLSLKEVKDIEKIKSILRNLKMDEFGKTYENIINQISETEIVPSPPIVGYGILKISFNEQPNEMEVKDVEIKDKK